MRAVLITGAGRGFSSGADLKAGFEAHPDDGMPDIQKELELYHLAITGIRRLPKPVVAAVNGAAVGIGASLAFACDLVLAAESAFFGLAFVNIGLMPDGGSTLFVPAAVGKARAFEMAHARRARAGQPGARLGPRELRPPRRAQPRTRRTYSWRSWPTGPTLSYAGTKEALNQMLYPDMDEQLDARGGDPASPRRTKDFMEGVGAFVEKRPARFTGG